MKLRHLITPIAFLITAQFSFAQGKPEKVIRKLEQMEAVSIQKGDTIKAGQIDYSSYERDVERITFSGNLAVVMGKEVVVPRNATPDVGKTITMRYTHVWVKQNKVWHLAARQASNFGQ